MFENIPDTVLDKMILDALLADPDVQMSVSESGEAVFWSMASVRAS